MWKMIHITKAPSCRHKNEYAIFVIAHVFKNGFRRKPSIETRFWHTGYLYCFFKMKFILYIDTPWYFPDTCYATSYCKNFGNLKPKSKRISSNYVINFNKVWINILCLFIPKSLWVKPKIYLISSCLVLQIYAASKFRAN